LGKGGTGVLTVDGKVLSTQKMEHTIPFLMALDESLDIGLDTRTPVDESYKLPFRFTGTINKVTYSIKPEQLSVADREAMQRVVAAARDTPTQ
jgi:arylsulfatase